MPRKGVAKYIPTANPRFFRDFRRNPRFSPKPEIFAETRDFRRNPRFSPKSEIFAEIRDFRRNSRFSPKSEIFAKIRDFRQMRSLDERRTAVFWRPNFSKILKKIQNFNWPGLGPVRAVPSVRAVPPSPGQLKFWNFYWKFFKTNEKNIGMYLDRNVLGIAVTTRR